MGARLLLILSASLMCFAFGDLCGALSSCISRRFALGSDMSSVTSMTSAATRSPNSCASFSRVTPVSSTVSCSQPAAMSSASSPSVTSARMFATSARWLIYGSLPRPFRAMPLCRRAARSAASDTSRRPESIASQLAHDVAAKTVDRALACERHELHVAGLAGLEADGGAGGDVEAHAAGLFPLEFQRGIGLEEVVVRAHLNGTVAGIGD